VEMYGGRPTMNFGQTNLVKSAHSMPPFKNHSSQALVDLASKWGQPATFRAHLVRAWSYVAFPVSGHPW
jgi:hypothetical protein